ncbi:hypothetical protein GCK72_001881 [Caenorhabditis remanei]|uniref:Uncharacterized protein n=1 Tax=Caenorhabditis remanei TaxID=31234 RepID=A0A6A5HTV1_CAERE|nr:hypothetical protein GCK72_001881 [Caenorhabditis remanei]KAF1770064.1 hypothetical protein GCK72_001881 [Caenorhabditis remanei]
MTNPLLKSSGSFEFKHVIGVPNDADSENCLDFNYLEIPWKLTVHKKVFKLDFNLICLNEYFQQLIGEVQFCLVSFDDSGIRSEWKNVNVEISSHNKMSSSITWNELKQYQKNKQLCILYRIDLLEKEIVVPDITQFFYIDDETKEDTIDELLVDKKEEHIQTEVNQSDPPENLTTFLQELLIVSNDMSQNMNCHFCGQGKVPYSLNPISFSCTHKKCRVRRTFSLHQLLKMKENWIEGTFPEPPTSLYNTQEKENDGSTISEFLMEQLEKIN